MADINEFQKAIGVTFDDPKLLEQAFTHRSYLNENKDIPHGHNERLEFLGDAVLELVMTDHLYRTFPDVPEGELTAYRSALVRTESISEAADVLKMGDYLMLSKGEAKDRGKARSYILANTFEAVIGAIYLDQGYDVAAKFIGTALFHKMDSVIEDGSWKDSKSYVQEKAQEVYDVTPSYEVIKESGPDHDKNFVMGIYFGDKLVAQGRGKSKQEAQQSAAQAAIEKEEW